jgi:signal transduction histidine kinase
MKSFEQGYLLVVDDDEANREILSRRLRYEGYGVAVAVDGSQALELIQNENYDLVLLDVTMPGMSGFEVLEIVRQKYTLAELPVILVTALDASKDITTGFKLGANDYVTKPLDFPVLFARLQNQLQVRNLTQLKDQFLQIASHDLKNPLGNVLMSADMLLEVIPPGETMSEEMYGVMSRIVRHCRTMQRIITDFLDFQSLQDGTLQPRLAPTDLNQLVRCIVEDNADYARKKNVEVSVELGESLPPVSSDSAWLAQVIQNLVGNAIKFGPLDTRVIVRTEMRDAFVVVEVCDSGPGLKEADFEKVFVKYARLSNKPTGGEKSSGLGLAISKQMIELQGGSIGVRNNPEKGATFWFSLPVVSEVVS